MTPALNSISCTPSQKVTNVDENKPYNFIISIRNCFKGKAHLYLQFCLNLSTQLCSLVHHELKTSCPLLMWNINNFEAPFSVAALWFASLLLLSHYFIMAMKHNKMSPKHSLWLVFITTGLLTAWEEEKLSFLLLGVTPNTIMKPQNY